MKALRYMLFTMVLALGVLGFTGTTHAFNWEDGWEDSADYMSKDENGNLIPDTERNWLAINNQPVAYYHTDTTETDDSYTITGYVPAMLNGDRVNLILVFDSENPDGYIAGASTDYINNETDTVPKSLTEINVGDKLDFLCDFYSYDGEYQDSYYLSEQVTVSDNMTISNVDVGEGEVRLMYRFTDIYNQVYWSEPISE